MLYHLIEKIRIYLIQYLLTNEEMCYIVKQVPNNYYKILKTSSNCEIFYIKRSADFFKLPMRHKRLLYAIDENGNDITSQFNEYLDGGFDITDDVLPEIFDLKTIHVIHKEDLSENIYELSSNRKLQCLKEKNN